MTLDALVARFFTATPAREARAGALPQPSTASATRRAGTRLAVPRAYAGWLGYDHLHVPALVGFELRVGRTIAMTLAQTGSTIVTMPSKCPVGYSWIHRDGRLRALLRPVLPAVRPRPLRPAGGGPRAQRAAPAFSPRRCHRLGASRRPGGGRRAGPPSGLVLERLVQALGDGDWAGPRNEPSPQPPSVWPAWSSRSARASTGSGSAVRCPPCATASCVVKRAWGCRASLGCQPPHAADRLVNSGACRRPFCT